MPKKQRLSAKRIFDLLRDEGYTGGYTQVKEAVRSIRKTRKEVFMPLSHFPGEAQFDFGFALVNLNGELRKAAFSVMVLPYSGAVHVQLFERVCTEVIWKAHNRAFAFFGGVPSRISYDNDSVLVSHLRTGKGRRRLTEGFLQLIDICISNAIYCGILKGGCHSETKRISENTGATATESRCLA
jgi:transposase